MIIKANGFLFKPIIVKKITCSLPIINFVGTYMYMYEHIKFSSAPKSLLIQKVSVVIYTSVQTTHY